MDRPVLEEPPASSLATEFNRETTSRLRCGWIIVALVIAATACAESGRRQAATPSPATPSPESPHAAASPALVWVAVEGARKIVLVDLAEARVVEEYSVPGNPHNITVSADGIVAATLPSAGKVVLIAGGAVEVIDLGDEPHDVKSSGDSFVVANEDGSRIDFLTRSGDRQDSVSLRAQPHDLAVSSDGSEAWVSLNRSGELAVVGLDGQSSLRYVPVGERPHDLLFAPNGGLWVSDWGGSVRVISTQGQLMGRIPGVEAHHLAFSPTSLGADEAWITDHGAKSVLIVSVETLELTQSLKLAGAPHHVAFSADGSLAAVADNENGTLVVFDVAARRQLATIPVGAGPHGVWNSPAR